MPGTMLITGGGRGIGAATAALAATRGHAVAVNYLQDQRAADAVVSAIRAAGGAAIAVRADVSQEADVDRMFREAEHALGPIRVLVNNAGIVDLKARVDEMHQPRLQRMMAVNVVGPILCAAGAVRRMSTRLGGQGGSIVNVSSAASKYGSPGEYVDYAASKGAIDTFTIGLAREVASEGVRVNAVRPGIIDTQIHAGSGDAARAHRLAPTLPLQRPGTAQEVANAIVWLASDEASYCTGTILDVAGGR